MFVSTHQPKEHSFKACPESYKTPCTHNKDLFICPVSFISFSILVICSLLLVCQGSKCMNMYIYRLINPLLDPTKS